MSNKLKTLSSSQLENLISDAVGSYLNEECIGQISDLSTPNIDSEDNPGMENQRTIRFNFELSYQDS